MPEINTEAWGAQYNDPKAPPSPNAPKERTGFIDGLKATWRQESIWEPSQVRPSLEYPEDSHFDYKTYDKKYWGVVSRARNRDHAEDIIKQFDKEIENRKIMENQHWALGFTNELIVGLTNPLNYIGAGAGKTVLGAAGRTALGAMAGTAITEPILHGRQVTRTAEESLFNIGGAGVGGALLGGGGKAIANKWKTGSWASADTPTVSPELSQQVLNQALDNQPFLASGSIGAAQHTPLSADGSKVAKLGWLPESWSDSITRFSYLGDLARSTNQRLMTSRFAGSRDFAQRVLRTSLATNDQMDGIAKQVPVEVAANQRLHEESIKLVKADHELRDSWWNKVEAGTYDQAEIMAAVRELYPSLPQDYKVNRTTFDLLTKAEMAGAAEFSRTMDEVGKRAKLAGDLNKQLDAEKIDFGLLDKKKLFDLATGERIKDPMDGIHAAMLQELRKQQSELIAERNALRDLKKKNGAHTPDEVSKLKELDDKIKGHEKAIADKKVELETAIKDYENIYPDSTRHGIAYEDGNHYLSRLFDKARIIADPQGFKAQLIKGWVARNPELDVANKQIAAQLETAAEKVRATLLNEENINTLGEISIRLQKDLDALANFTKDRTLNIDDKYLLDFTNHSVTDTQLYHLSQAITDVELARAGFSFSEAKRAVELEAQKAIAEINAEHGVNSKKALKLINEIEVEKAKDIAEMEFAMRKLKRQGPTGTEAYTIKSLNSGLGRLNKISGMAQLGSSAIPNSLGDVASMATHLGVGRTYKIMAKWLFDKEFREFMSKNAQQVGVLAELVNKSMREAHMADVYTESLNPNKGFRSSGWNTFDRGLNWVADKYATISFIDGWSKVGRTVASAAANEQIVTAASKGWDNLPKHLQTELAKFYIDDSMLKRIGDQIKAHGTDKDGVKFAEPDSWADQEAARVFKQSIYAMTEYSLNIPSIGTGSSFITDTTAGRVFMRFKSFNNASHESTFLGSLQNREVSRIATGTMNWLFWGFMSTYAYDLFKGNPHSMDDYFGSPEKIQKTFWKALTKSGYIAAAGDAAVAGLKAVGSIKGPIGDAVHKVIPKGIEDEIFPKFKDVGALEKIAGPTYGYMSKAADTVGGLLNTSDGISEKDVHNIRGLLPVNNIFWLRRGLDHIEEALGGYKANRPPK